MQKTPFAGLTVLDPDESIYADNSAFISRDRFEIDRLGKIGVKLHRHNGLAGLPNPALPPSGAVVGSGGTIPAGIALTLGYTLEDDMGGETQISPTVLVTLPPPIELPTDEPEAALETTAGELEADTYTYAVTWSDGEGGETPLGPSVTVNVPPGFAHAQIKLDGLDDGMEAAGAVAWRLYRARAGGVYVFLTEDDTASFTDSGTIAAQCDIHPPTSNVNTTGSTNQIAYTIPSGSAIAEGTFINLYASQSGNFEESCLLAQVPVSEAGKTILFSSLELLDWQPPDVNRSYGGANQIDPDTELIDWHWKRPVEKKAELPSSENEEGDVRLVIEDNALYQWNGTEWTVLEFTAGAVKDERIDAEGMGVVKFGSDLTFPRPVGGFEQYTWIGEAGGVAPEHMDEFDVLLDLAP